MYRLSQWAGDFPMLWEPHGSFTPLFTSQPEELAFSKSVSLRLHISASCPVFLFSVLFFFLSFPLFLPLIWTTAQAVQISRTAVPSWSSGSHVTTDTQTRSQPMLVNQAFLPHNDWPCEDTEWHTAQWEWRWWKESSWQHLLVPTASYALSGTLFLLYTTGLSPMWSDWQCH